MAAGRVRGRGGRAVPRRRAGARARAALQPADPGVALRLGRRRACWSSPSPPWVRCGRSRASSTPAGARCPAAASWAAARWRRSAALSARLRSSSCSSPATSGTGLRARQPRADVRPRSSSGSASRSRRILLGRRLPPREPVARDRASSRSDRAAAAPARLPRADRPLAGRGRAARLHLGRTRLRLGEKTRARSRQRRSSTPSTRSPPMAVLRRRAVDA